MSSTFQHNNGTISYELHGEDNPKETVVLIHGFGLDKRQWEPQIKELTKEGHPVLTYDMRGFGESAVPNGKYSHSEDLKELMDHLGIEDATICGHSFGGSVAIDFALKYPETTKELLLLSPSLGTLSPENKETTEQMKRWAELAQEGQIDTIRGEILAHPSLNSLRQNPADFELVSEIVNSYSGWHFLHLHADPGEKLYRVMEHLPEVKCPVEIMIGKEESEGDKEILAELVSKTENAELKVLEGGHFLNIEDAKEVSETMHELSEGHEENLGLNFK